MKYLFGDTEIAGRRLKVLAETFAESTRAFLLEAGAERPRLALDLGCGPGCTTHLLAEALQCDRAVGLDHSERFLSRARKTETPRVSFRLHDVRSVPFPTGPADVLFCRFLLSHMQDPRALVAKWGTQLRPKGLLLMEEVEWIDRTNAAFATYIEIVEAMLAHQSNSLCVGPVLDAIEGIDALLKRTSGVRRFRVANSRAATLFVMNMQTCQHQSFVRANYPAATIAALQQELHALARAGDAGSDIEWGLRQIVFERVKA